MLLQVDDTINMAGYVRGWLFIQVTACLAWDPMLVEGQHLGLLLF